MHHFQSQTIEEVLLLKHCLLDVHKISTPPRSVSETAEQSSVALTGVILR